ncbi:MAG: hypothetical protein GWN85_39330, partial [Gemmatimonadetes bacterium]|nr:hypothetical protein [Gemmatimonadota bacterium]NIR41382.1 hypothetical protein [Actinomycetota bacterium]NIS36401.1 hypothetical protein [Actinomycetota bacterium]NIU70922.1 hypothetical protein [Actinomycetota bacterium]NIW32855.1 hypothetical protein [Actinomycetota bacterium]
MVAAEFVNEPVHALVAASGAMLVGTEVGWRYSPVDSVTTALSFGPVVPVGAVRQFVLDSEGPEVFAWFTWTNITAGNSGLGRIRLARFTETNVPAYASDIYSAAGGTVLTVASLSDRRYFGVSVDGFYGATGDLVASGTLS